MALLLVVMVGFAAVLVDLANARQIRRQAQSSADATALAAAQDLPQGPDVVATVKQYAADNYGTTAAEWVGCTDSEALAVEPDSANNNTCISIDPGFRRVRVQMPNRSAETYFGGVFGRDGIDVAAAAVAGTEFRNDDRIIPASVTVGQGTGNLCVENSGNDAACATRNAGNFGSLASPRLSFYLTSNHQDRLRINWAMSLDHDIDRNNGAFPTVCDGTVRSPCDDTNSLGPNTAEYLQVETGNNVPDVTDGLITGFTAPTDDEGNVFFCGRLSRPETTESNIFEADPGCSPGSGPTLDVLGTTINARHIYYWMTDEAKQTFYPEVWAVDTADGPAIGDPLYDLGDQRLECFTEQYRYDQATGAETVPDCTSLAIADFDGLYQDVSDTALWPIIEKGVAADARFGVIPVLGYWPSGSCCAAPLEGFWGQFLYRHYTNATSLRGIDAWIYDPALIETESGQPGIEFGFQVQGQSSLIE